MSVFLDQVTHNLHLLARSDEPRILSLVTNNSLIPSDGSAGTVKLIENFSLLNLVIKNDVEVGELLSLNLKSFCDHLLIDQECGKSLDKSLYSLFKSTQLDPIAFHSTSITLTAFEALFSCLSSKEDFRSAVVFGGGQIGKSVGRFLLEVGVEVTVVTRQPAELVKSAITSSSRNSMWATLSVTPTIPINSDARLIIGATAGVPVIPLDFVRDRPSSTALIDVGIGTVQREALDFLLAVGFPLYTINFEIALVSWFRSFAFVRENLNKKRSFVLSCGHKFIQLGYKGAVGDFVVDDVMNPTTIYGRINKQGGLEPATHLVKSHSKTCSTSF
jgi:hypothetical protein